MISQTDIQGVQDFIYYREVKQQINDYLTGKADLIKAETTEWPPYDEHFKWLRTELTGFGGIPNHGKSKFVIFLTALKMLKANWKVAVYAPETTPPIFFYANYLHTFTGKSLFGDHKPTPKDIAPYEPLLQNNLYLCEPEKLPTFAGIIERFERAFEYHGSDMFVIDPFNCLEREWETSKRDDRYVGDFLEHYKDFVKRTNTVGIVVMHPNSGMRLGKNDLNYECPNMYNLAGGAMWGNKLDNLVFVHRPYFISNFKNSAVLIRHSKIKKREIVGSGGDVEINFGFRQNRYVMHGQDGMGGVYDDMPEIERTDNDLPF